MLQVYVIPSFTFESGTTLENVPVGFRSWGRLNHAADNVIVIGHSLTSDTNVAKWWERCIGSGRALDTDRYFVVCLNVIGSPYGSVSPVTINPDTRRAYGADMPQATVRDTVELHRVVLDRLGVRKVAFAIGGSMGGMQVLEWSFYGDYVRGLVPIGVGGRHSAWCIAWSEAQRQAIFADPTFRGGSYHPARQPEAGLAAARMIAMLSYRSFDSFEERFGRERTNGAPDSPYLVEDYLHHHGEKLVRRFDANCYVYLTRLMDSHDVSRGRGEYLDVLREIRQDTLVVGMESDVLYRPSEQRELAENLPNAELALLHAAHGHDTFLIEQKELSDVVKTWRERTIDPHVL